MNLTEKQIGILLHALGLDRKRDSYRNHFAAGPDDEPDCRALVEEGLMRHIPAGPYYYCLVTERGISVAMSHRPEPPKLTRSQKRYQRYLAADCGLSFGEWLRFAAMADRWAREERL